MRAENNDYKTALSVTYRKRDMLLGLVGGRCSQCGTLAVPAHGQFASTRNAHAQGAQEPCSFREQPGEGSHPGRRTISPTRRTPPSHYCMIAFDEGGRFMTDFTDVAAGEVEVGLPVYMVFRIKSVDSLRGFVRYFWKAAPAAR